MRKRLIYPYLFIIGLFVTLYVITQTIPNETLYVYIGLGFAKEWAEVKMNNKLPLQTEIFLYALPFFVIAVNFLQILTLYKDSFWDRFSFSIVTILLVYILNWVTFLLIDIPAWNIYDSYRGNMASWDCFVTLVFTIGTLLPMEIIKWIAFRLIKRERIRKYLPNWTLENKTYYQSPHDPN